MILLPAETVHSSTVMVSIQVGNSFMVDPEVMKSMEAMTNKPSTLPVALETIGSGLAIILVTIMTSKTMIL